MNWHRRNVWCFLSHQTPLLSGMFENEVVPMNVATICSRPGPRPQVGQPMASQVNNGTSFGTDSHRGDICIHLVATLYCIVTGIAISARNDDFIKPHCHAKAVAARIMKEYLLSK